MISKEDFLVFVDGALDGMVAIVEELGDELANRRPDVDGTNTPYVILSHCLGVMEYWAGHAVAGRPIERHRPAEFVASGPVAALAERTRVARRQLGEDLAHLDPLAAPALPIDEKERDEVFGRTQGGALVHLYEELARHRGQMETCRDVLGAPWARVVTQTGLAGWASAAAERSRWILELAAEGRWDEVRLNFDDRMLASAPVGMLTGAWAQVIVLLGAFTAFGEPDVRVDSGHRVVDVPMHFERGWLTGRVALGLDDTVAGLFFLHPQAGPAS
ncbi:MAG: DUF664 domain-containing protein [Acidimicrobiales bacterium]|jgi:hypothetical protein